MGILRVSAGQRLLQSTGAPLPKPLANTYARPPDWGTGLLMEQNHPLFRFTS
jgi:hypothetical protein